MNSTIRETADKLVDDTLQHVKKRQTLAKNLQAKELRRELVTAATDQNARMTLDSLATSAATGKPITRLKPQPKTR